MSICLTNVCEEQTWRRIQEDRWLYSLLQQTRRVCRFFQVCLCQPRAKPGQAIFYAMERPDPMIALAQRLKHTFADCPNPRVSSFDRNKIKSLFQVLAEEEFKGNRLQKIPTSCLLLDKELNGGLSIGNLVEIYGVAGTGKTQFAMQMCVNVQKPKRLQGLEAEALFIDGESSFRPSRLLEMAEVVSAEWFGSESNPESFLKRTHYLQIRSLEMAKVAICFHLQDFLDSHPLV